MIFQWLRSAGSNFGEVSKPLRVYRGAKPSSGTLKKLSGLGVRTILDLRNDEIGDAKQKAEQLGFKWVRIPLADDAAPSPIQVKEALDLIDMGFIFFACMGGRHRGGLICAAWRVRSCGWTKQKAWAEAKKFGWYGALGHQPLADWFFNEFNP
jgi:Predicted protein-tyrosine phosphatase